MAQQLLMAHRHSDQRTTTEAEPVVVDTDNPSIVVLQLDDGQRLELDTDELRAALGDHEQAA